MKTPTFTQAIKAARFADDRMAVGARRSSDAGCSKGAAEFGSLEEASSPLWSRGLVMSVPAVEHWKGQAHLRGNIAA
jgi:hypothetical protein